MRGVVGLTGAEMSSRVVDPQSLMDFAARILEAVGVPPDHARTAAQVLTVTEMRGIRSHGLMRMEKYVDCILSGGINAAARPEVVRQGPSWTLTDGGGGLGMVTGCFAVTEAMRRARLSGLAVSLVRNSRHFGAAGYYSGLCAQAGMIGLSMSNGDVIMAVSGSSRSAIGNNPFSYAAPAGKYGWLMLDIAMSKLSDGKIQIARARGEQLVPDAILDAGGNPTTRPQDYFDGGTLLPFGDYKGYGLAVLVELLAGVLTGASFLREVRAWNASAEPGKDAGHFFLAMDIAKFMPVEQYAARVEEVVQQIRSAPRRPGVESILVPGQLELDSEQRAARCGVELLDSCWESLERAAAKAGLPCESASPAGDWRLP